MFVVFFKLSNSSCNFFISWFFFFFSSVFSLISEYLNLTKKEIRYDKFDNAVIGKFSNPFNIPKLPNYEQKILRQDKKPNRYNNINNSMNYKKNINTNTSSRTANSTRRKSKNKITSPQEKKKEVK